MCPSDIRRARGAGAPSRPGVRLALTQRPKRGQFSSPRGPRRAPGRPGDWLNRSEPFYTTIGPRGATRMPQITATGPHRLRILLILRRFSYFDPLFHMRSFTRAAYAPPAARTRHISRGDTRWTILQLLGRLPGHLGRPVARDVQRVARRRRPRMAGRRVWKRSHAASRGSSTPGRVIGDSLQR